MKPVPTLIAGASLFAALVLPVSAQPPQVTFVQEPIASASKQDDRAKAIVDAMNADASLKDSKITVQPGDDGSITLTGATMTEAQVKRAGEIAAAANGDGKVINTILPSEPPVAQR